ncbi:MAG: hypothetical protein ACRC5C_05325 [Bacilli bacterium]
MMRVFKSMFIVITIISVLCIIDYTLARTGRSPIFPIVVVTEDDGMRTFYGAGYKIVRNVHDAEQVELSFITLADFQ